MAHVREQFTESIGPVDDSYVTCFFLIPPREAESED